MIVRAYELGMGVGRFSRPLSGVDGVDVTQ